LAIWLHYRQKRRKAAQLNWSENPADFSLTLADEASQSIAISPLAPEDRLGLIRECRKQLRKSKAKFMALKSDFTGTLKNIASSGNLLLENDRHMDALNKKIEVYEKQIADLQHKLSVLETAIPVQVDPHMESIASQHEIVDTGSVNVILVGRDPVSSNTGLAEVGELAALQELQQKLQLLERENTGLKKKITEKEEEIAQNRELLKNIYKELKQSAVNKTREIAEQPLS